MPHDFHLDRFVNAQDPVINDVREELRAGAKRTHWMWFVFPQLAGLGHSRTSQFYGISSLAEAREYLEHPVLGPRLRECTELVNAVVGRSAHVIFGTPDDLKLHSSMTLFAHIDGESGPFHAALKKYYGGEIEARTIQLLERESEA